MNIYVIVGIVEFGGTTTCDECGQDWHRERDMEVREQVQAEDEESAKVIALAKAKKEIGWDYHNIDFIRWGNARHYGRPEVEFVREVTEAERMKQIGAPMLFQM